MKATTIAVFGLTAASVCAQPIVIPREYYNAGLPRALADLEARGWGWPHININWNKIGNWAKNAVKHVDWGKVGQTAVQIGSSLFGKRDEDELFAREFINDADIAIRDFYDNYLEMRDLDDNYLEQRDSEVLDLELRDEQEDEDSTPVRRPPPRLLRHGATHNKVGKVSRPGKLWADRGRPYHGGSRDRPWRPAGNSDDLD